MNEENDLFIYFIIDRSGSMAGHEDDTIGGINGFIKEQKKQGKKLNATTRVSMCLFDDKYEYPYKDVNIDKVKKLNSTTYVPRGTTALLDAIGFSVKEASEMLDMPPKVMIVIVTDGLENASYEWNYEKIKKLIKKQEKKGWVFTFLQAELGKEAASNFARLSGTPVGNTMSYGHGQTNSAYNAASQGATNLRSTGVTGQSINSAGLYGDDVKEIKEDES